MIVWVSVYTGTHPCILHIYVTNKPLLLFFFWYRIQEYYYVPVLMKTTVYWSKCGQYFLWWLLVPEHIGDHSLILPDCWIRLKRMVESRISYDCISITLFSADWVLKCLNLDQKQARIETSPLICARSELDSNFMSRVMWQLGTLLLSRGKVAINRAKTHMVSREKPHLESILLQHQQSTWENSGTENAELCPKEWSFCVSSWLNWKSFPSIEDEEKAMDSRSDQGENSAKIQWKLIYRTIPLLL